MTKFFAIRWPPYVCWLCCGCLPTLDTFPDTFAGFVWFALVVYFADFTISRPSRSLQGLVGNFYHMASSRATAIGLVPLRLRLLKCAIYGFVSYLL
jgi:hypothetical protein